MNKVKLNDVIEDMFDALDLNSVAKPGIKNLAIISIFIIYHVFLYPAVAV